MKPLAKIATVIGLVTLLSFFKPKKNNAIIIGDSQTFLITDLTKKVKLNQSLCKTGWTVANLIAALDKQPIDNKTTEVFICIGTNGNFNKTDKIESLIWFVQTKFPKAKLYAIQGSYGWGNNTTTPDLNSYYIRFYNKGVYVLKNKIGFSNNHPTTSTPSIKLIALEINSLV